MEGTPLLSRETELQNPNEWQGVVVGAAVSDVEQQRVRSLSSRHTAPVVVLRDAPNDYDNNWSGPPSCIVCNCSCMLCSIMVFLCVVIALLIAGSVLRE